MRAKLRLNMSGIECSLRSSYSDMTRIEWNDSGNQELGVT